MGRCGIGSGYRIIAVPTPGMAGQDAFNSEVPAFKYTILFNGSDAIVGAGGGVPALVGAQVGGNTPLV